ncbi:uncharacterized protein VTP21DRAFT_5871 [Calcarisporiella thermophila]|uniref:uncharacterized protein n=1 Tax=Calcarisporiella thermophila TaxID=911321 RepID=UPI003743A089
MLVPTTWRYVISISPLTRRSFSTSMAVRYHRLSAMFHPTMKKEADLGQEEDAHRLMLRAGLIRQSSSGMYSLLPLGVRFMDKLTRIIDEELEAIGCQKVSLPLLLPAELWKTTGRWDSFGHELFRLKDRKSSAFALAPTHEEEITSLVANEINSYRQLPVRLYQIDRKYRDEMRPRGGLLRGREFLMKDLYTFDATIEEAIQTYDEVGRAYRNIFKRIGIPFVVAEADTGNIGGTSSHEYHYLSPAGEDSVLSCQQCGYTANEEMAVGKLPKPSQGHSLSRVLSAAEQDEIPRHEEWRVRWAVHKMPGEERLLAIVLASGRDVNTIKLRKLLGGEGDIAFRSEEVGGTKEWLASKELKGLEVVVDESIRVDETLIRDGAIGRLAARHLQVRCGDVHNTLAGDACPSCEHPSLDFGRAIEVGHTFLLGTKYSQTLNAGFVPQSGGERLPFQMGCYGIGVSRLLAAVVHCSRDERGILFPPSVSPYRVVVLPADESEGVREGCEAVCRAVEKVPFLSQEVVIDDRRGGFGFRVADAELAGYPWAIVVGRGLKRGVVELRERVRGGWRAEEVRIEEVAQHLKTRLI